MLIQQFDFQVAQFESVDQVVKEEVLQADIVEIRGFVEGGIYHSQHMRWWGNLNGFDIAKSFIRSKKERKVIEENKAWFEQQGYHFEIVPVTQKVYEEFETLYQSTTLKRERPLFFSLKEQILSKVLVGMPVFVIGMFRESVLESGLVFSVSESSRAIVSFGAKKKFEERRGGVGGVLELLLAEYCLSHDISQISHGQSRNPSGITSKAGIFEFKARYGFSAFPEGYWKTTFILNPSIMLSDIVFVTMIDNKIGYIVVSDNLETEVQGKYKTREINNIKVIPLNRIKQSASEFISSLK